MKYHLKVVENVDAYQDLMMSHFNDVFSACHYCGVVYCVLSKLSMPQVSTNGSFGIGLCHLVSVHNSSRSHNS